MKNNILFSILSLIVGGAVVWLVLGRTPAAQVSNSAGTDKKFTAVRHASDMADSANGKRVTKRPRGTKPRDEDELEEFADSLKDKVVVDLGTVEDMGKQTAAMMLAQKELSQLAAIPPDRRTPSQSQRLLALQRQQATALGVLPEITSFQNDPDQYGHYFASLLHEAASLNETQTASAFDYMKGRGEALVRAGMNAANEPDDPDLRALWEGRRDAFNAQTAAGIAGLLAPGEAERIGFTPDFMELLEQDFDKAEAQADAEPEAPPAPENGPPN